MFGAAAAASAPSSASEPVCPEPKLFVGGLSFDATEEDLMKLFSQYGPIQQCTLLRNRETGKSKGCAMVLFQKWASAEAAANAENGTSTLSGPRKTIVKFADPHLVDGVFVGVTPKKLFVGQVPSGTTREYINALFSQYGTITDVNIMAPKKQGAMGCAFVTFVSWAEAESAMDALNGQYTFPAATNVTTIKFADAKPAELQRAGNKRLAGELMGGGSSKRMTMGGKGGAFPNAMMGMGMGPMGNMGGMNNMSNMMGMMMMNMMGLGPMGPMGNMPGMPGMPGAFGGAAGAHAGPGGGFGGGGGALQQQGGMGGAQQGGGPGGPGGGGEGGMMHHHGAAGGPGGANAASMAGIMQAAGNLAAMNMGGGGGAGMMPGLGLAALGGTLPSVAPNGAMRASGASLTTIAGAKPWKLFVGQLSYELGEGDLWMFFSQFGSLLEVAVLRNPQDRRSRGCAFVTFGSAEEAQAALAANGAVIPTDPRSRSISVKFAEQK